MTHRVPLSFRWFMQNGWTDPQGGWGGAQGADYVVEKNGVTFRQYDWTHKWFNEKDRPTKDNGIEFVDELPKELQ